MKTLPTSHIQITAKTTLFIHLSHPHHSMLGPSKDISPPHHNNLQETGEHLTDYGRKCANIFVRTAVWSAHISNKCMNYVHKWMLVVDKMSKVIYNKINTAHRILHLGHNTQFIDYWSILNEQENTSWITQIGECFCVCDEDKMTSIPMGKLVQTQCLHKYEYIPWRTVTFFKMTSSLRRIHTPFVR